MDSNVLPDVPAIPSGYLPLSINSAGFGGSGGRPFLFPISLTEAR